MLNTEEGGLKDDQLKRFRLEKPSDLDHTWKSLTRGRHGCDLFAYEKAKDKTTQQYVFRL